LKWKPALILFIFLFSFIPLNPVLGQGNYWAEIQLEEIYGIRGENIGITALTNDSTVIVRIYDPSNILIYDKVWNANETRNIPIGDSADYGTYTITGEAGDSKATTWFTVLDISGWQPIPKWPHIEPHNSIWYHFNSDWTVDAYLGEDRLHIDFSTLREIAQEYDMDVNPYYNSMNFLVRFSKGDNRVDWNFAFIHTGAKIIINGTLNQAKDIEINFNGKRFKKWLNGVSSGHILFDWSDILGVHWWGYNRFEQKLTIQAPKTFRIDPTIFEDGFESGLTPWDGSNGSPTIVQSPVHCGVNACAFDADNEYLYDDFTGQEPVYSRGYYRFAAFPASGRNIKIMQLRRVGTGTSPVVFIVDDSGTAKWRLLTNNGNTLTADSPTPSLNTWYSVEMACNVDNETALYIDGSKILTGGTTSGDTFDRAYFGRWNNGVDTITVYLDCVIISDSYNGPETAGVEYERNPTQSISFSGNVTRTWSLSRVLTQSLTFTWNAYGFHTAFEQFVRTITLAINWASSISRWVDFHRAFSQSLTFTWNALDLNGENG